MAPFLPEYAFEPGTAAVPTRRDIGPFWIVLLLSVLVHLAVLFFLPPLRFDLRPAGDPDSPLAVELRPRPPAPKAPASVAKPTAIPPIAEAPPAPPRAVPPPKVATPAKPSARPAPAATPAPPQPAPRSVTPSEPVSPPVIAATKPAPEATPRVVQPEPAVTERPAPSRGSDLSSYIESQRRARDAPSSDSSWRLEAPKPTEDARRDRDRIAAANLGVGQTPTFGPRRQGGGLFQITRLHYSNAEFVFFGWNKDIRRNTQQTVEVRKGEHSDIRIAVIRRMIGIIREHESGDFLWQSDRLGRAVMLSARPADNAGLEDFLWQEFFDEPRPGMGAVGRVQP